MKRFKKVFASFTLACLALTTMPAGMVWADGETAVISATYTFTDSTDYTKGITPENSIKNGVYGEQRTLVSGAFGRSDDDYSLQNANSGGVKSHVRMGCLPKTDNVPSDFPSMSFTGGILNIKASLAYPSGQTFTKLSLMPYITFNTSGNSQGVENFMVIDGSGALTLCGKNTGITVKPDRFYTFDIYINRSTKICKLFVNGQDVFATTEVKVGDGSQNGAYYPWGTNNVKDFTIHALNGIIFNKEYASGTATSENPQSFYVDDVYITSGDSIEMQAQCSIKDRITTQNAGIDTQDQSVILSADVKNEILANQTATTKTWTKVTAALGDKFDTTNENLEITTVNNQEMLILTNSDGTKYFYDIKAAKDRLFTFDQNTTDCTAPNWEGSSAQAVGGKYGKIETDKAYEISRLSNTTVTKAETAISGRIGSGMEINGEMLNIRASLAIPSEQAFTTVEINPLLHLTWTQTNGQSATESRSVFNFIKVNGDGSLAFCGKTVSGVTIAQNQFVTLDTYLNTVTQKADLYINGFKVASEYIGKGGNVATAPYLNYGSNNFTTFTFDWVDRVDIVKTYEAANKEGQTLYVDDVYVAGGSIMLPDFSTRLKSNVGAYQDPTTKAVLLPDTIVNVADAFNLSTGETFTETAQAGRYLLTTASGAKYYYDQGVDFIRSTDAYAIYDANFDADTAFYEMKEDGGLWRVYNGTDNNGNAVNSSKTISNAFAVTTAPGQYGKDGKTFNIFMKESSAVSSGKITNDSSIGSIKETYVRKAYTDNAKYKYLADTVAAMGYDKFVVDFSFMAEDYHTEHNFNVDNLTQDNSYLGTQTFIRFDKNGNFGLVPKNGQYTKCLGNYDLKKWYRISAVFTLNSKAWDLYIDGNKISGVPELDRAFTLPVPTAEGEKTNMLGIFEVVSVPSAVEGKSADDNGCIAVADLAKSNAFLDDMTLYFTKSYTPAATTNLTTSYAVKKDQLYLGGADVTPAALTAAVSSAGNTLKLYDKNYNVVESTSTTAMSDIHYLIVQSADNKTLHRYTLNPTAADYVEINANNMANVAENGTYIFEVKDTDCVGGEALVIALYDTDNNLVSCKIAENFAKDASVEANLTQGKVKLFVWDMENLVPFDGSFYMTPQAD